MLFSFAHCLSLGVLVQVTEILTNSLLLQSEPGVINCVQITSFKLSAQQWLMTVRDTFELWNETMQKQQQIPTLVNTLCGKQSYVGEVVRKGEGLLCWCFDQRFCRLWYYFWDTYKLCILPSLYRWRASPVGNMAWYGHPLPCKLRTAKGEWVSALPTWTASFSLKGDSTSIQTLCFPSFCPGWPRLWMS